MGFFIGSYHRKITTPCIGVCTLRTDGLCEGCMRSADEISLWSGMSESERMKVMYEILPERRARAESTSG